MKKTEINWWWSGASYQANVAAWLTQGITDGGTPPTGAQLSALSTLMNTLNTLGLLSRFKTLNNLHLGSKEFAKLNLINPATYKYTESGTVTFSALNGCKSASSSYFNQAFKSDAFAGDALTFVQYISESNASFSTTSSHGHRTRSDVTSNNYLLPFVNPGQAQSATGTITATSPVNTNHKGFYLQTYVSPNNTIYVNGSKSVTSAPLQAPNISVDRIVLARNNATSSGVVTPIQHYTNYLAWDGILDAINDTDAANLLTAFDTYKTAVSLP